MLFLAMTHHLNRNSIPVSGSLWLNVFFLLSLLLCLCMILHLSYLYFFILNSQCKFSGWPGSVILVFSSRVSETWRLQLKGAVGLLEPKVTLMLLTCHFAESRRGTSPTCTTVSMLWWCQGSEVCGSHASGAAWMIQKIHNRKHRRFWPASGL